MDLLKFLTASMGLVTGTMLAAPCFALDVSQCDAALAKDTYESFASSSVDYRLALLVTQKEWDTASHNGGVNAVLYGIPVGANYSDYHNTVKDSLMSRNESLTDLEVRYLGIESLSNNGRDAYIACIRGLTHPIGISVSVGKMTPTIATIYIKYTNAPDRHPSPVRVRFVGANPVPGNRFPSSMNPGEETAVQVVRPSAQAVITVTVPGKYADDLTLMPPAPPLPLPPQYVLNVTDIDDQFSCQLNDKDEPSIQVGFGTSNSFNLSQWMHGGKNKLQCKIVDVHPDQNFHPCWGYHYTVTKVGVTTPISDHNVRSCGEGAQPPGPIAAEILLY